MIWHACAVVSKTCFLMNFWLQLMKIWRKSLHHKWTLLFQNMPSHETSFLMCQLAVGRSMQLSVWISKTSPKQHRPTFTLEQQSHLIGCLKHHMIFVNNDFQICEWSWLLMSATLIFNFLTCDGDPLTLLTSLRGGNPFTVCEKTLNLTMHLHRSFWSFYSQKFPVVWHHG